MRDKIEKLNGTNAVMGELINQIISEQILPGEKFPSENEMADQFGVSRLTVCAALQKMENGLITAAQNHIDLVELIKQRKKAEAV